MDGVTTARPASAVRLPGFRLLAVLVILAACLGLALAACGTTHSSHPRARASLHSAASAAATNPAVIQAQANLGAAIAAAFQPGQKHPGRTLYRTLRSNPEFAAGAGRRDARCVLRWLGTHLTTATSQSATAQATACAQGKP
jgi:hypothetical protein